MTSYEAVLFDFDGVLVDSEPLHFAAWIEILAPYGVKLDWAEYAATFNGVADFVMVQELSKQGGVTAPFEELWSHVGEKQTLLRERMLETLPMPESTRRLLGSLEELRLAVVSSSCRTEVEPPLVAAGVRNRFDIVVCREDVELLKPNPEPYLTAAKRLGVTRPLVVEDSDVGESAGVAAGFDVLRVKSAAEVADRVRERLGIL